MELTLWCERRAAAYDSRSAQARCEHKTCADSLCVIAANDAHSTHNSDLFANFSDFVFHFHYFLSVKLTPVGTTIYQGLRANDLDAGVNGLVEYSIVPGDGRGLGTDQGVGRDRINVADGAGFFAINLPHQGQVTVNRSLDYEKTQRYLVTVVATDRARNVSERFSTTTTLTVNIRDDDDQDPSFIYQGCMLLDGSCINPEYYATVSSGVLAGILAISPEKIQAVDMDSINSPIMYSFLSGVPSSYRDYFEINPNTGAVRQIKPVDTAAEEVSESRRFATAKLLVTVKPVDSNPPRISVTAVEGMVDENTPVGTKVIDAEGNPIILTVTDADLGPEDPKPQYSFELTTNFFEIDETGTLIVAEENLDRDPPSPGKFRFQVVAREKTGSAASAPLSLTVALNDVNDNAPRLPMISPITVQAGEGRREIVKVVATDNDLGANAEITYSIYHVSNNGQNRFKIDALSGAIEAIGKLNAAEQYSITVQATDHGGKSSQTIVEVTVVPGPNTRSPVFQQSSYQVTVSEGAPINSSVATIIATDPENDPVSYSIVSGNDLRQFGIDDKTGTISVIRRLDREDLTRYELLIKAEDEGGLSSTATVNIVVSDINDKNPEFTGQPYEFSVQEGLAGAVVGRVKATDSDEGVNAMISYSLPLDVPFLVDETTGEIKTRAALDYETTREYRFVITAKDGATEPRIATATVVIYVTDVEDEAPIFHLTTYEASVPENVPKFLVTHVSAADPDTKKQITYMIRQGPTDLFTIDPQLGVIHTSQGLDYERENQHILIIGTKENLSNKPGATTKVIIYVQDRNDIPPVFLTVPRPITLDDDVAISTHVTTVSATDSDGTAPGNKVRYEIVGRGKAPRYFQIDSDTGEMYVKDDLRKEPDNEYQVDVKAYDSGEPQLSTIISVPLFIRHIATVPPDIGLGFSDDSYTIEIPENTPDGALVKMFTVVNSRVKSHTVPLRCSITSGNESGMFSIGITEDRNCELRLVGKIDHEKQYEYHLKLQLDTLAGLGNPARISTMVKIQVQDLNDNVPQFVYPETSKRFSKEKYYGAVARDRKEVGGTVLQVKAADKDSGNLGNVEYRLIPDESGATDYFAVDPSTGSIRTRRGLDTIPDEQLPLRLTVEARDNPAAPNDYNVVKTEVVVNLIEDQSRLILVVDDKAAGEVQGQQDTLVSLLQQQAGLIVGVERVSARQYTKDNITLETDQASTDLWFYAIDPNTERILLRNSTKIKRSLLSLEAMSNITVEVAATLQASASSIHAPVHVTPVRTAVVAVQWEVFPYALIIIASLILILGTAGIVYICISWSRYRAYKERMQRMYVVPRYDPVFVEPNLKEYETQVLQMSVPLDDNDSYNDLQLDFSRKNHAFTLDNVSYITKDNGDSIGQQSPVSSDAATTTRASSLVGRHDNVNNNNIHQPGILNPVYDKSDDERGLNSSTNENVTFREKKDYSHLGFNYLIDRSPIETTTEL
ncbi:hypothetical protein J6590_063040 [Homalodisca vitripennis]|nr:hypothetical protein J6590_063040 [Homalodisca vitripennis]